MSLITNLQNLATRVATEIKSVRTLVNGNVADLSSLTTTNKTNLVAAINEVAAAGGGGGATALDGLSDVAITTPATGHIIRHNGTQFVNVAGSTIFDVAGSAAAAQAASQPLNTANLSAIAALVTTTYGRSLLTLADVAALRTAVGAATETTAGIVELATTTEATTGTDTTRAVTPAGVAAVVNALVAAAPGLLNTLDELAQAIGDDPNFSATMATALAGKQPLHAALTSLSGLTTVADRVPYTTAANTYAVATFTAAGRTLVGGADAAAQRTSLSVYSQTEIGNPETNLVTTFEAGLV